MRKLEFLPTRDCEAGYSPDLEEEEPGEKHRT